MRILLSELFSIYSCLNLFFLSFLNSYCIEKNTFGCAQHFFPMIGPLRPLHITCAEIKKKMSMQNNKRNSDQKIIKRRSQALKDGYRNVVSRATSSTQLAKFLTLLNTKKVWGGIETATYRTSWATFTTATLPFSCFTQALSYT